MPPPPPSPPLAAAWAGQPDLVRCWIPASQLEAKPRRTQGDGWPYWAALSCSWQGETRRRWWPRTEGHAHYRIPNTREYEDASLAHQTYSRTPRRWLKWKCCLAVCQSRERMWRKPWLQITTSNLAISKAGIFLSIRISIDGGFPCPVLMLDLDSSVKCSILSSPPRNAYGFLSGTKNASLWCCYQNRTAISNVWNELSSWYVFSSHF